jgi:hypothetical protein
VDSAWDAAITVSDTVTWEVAWIAVPKAAHEGNQDWNGDPALETARQTHREAEKCKQTRLLLDMIGNPFRPVTLNAEWLTPTVTALAQLVYDERAFDRLPILADALEDAGCNDRAILDHCRCPGPHVRGCWVVDLVLGKD